PIERQLERNLATHGIAAGWFDFAGVEILDGDTPLDEFRLKDIPQRVHLVVVLGGKRDLSAGAIQLDGSRRSLEIVALRDLLLGLVNGVVDLLEIDAGSHIERSLLRHGQKSNRQPENDVQRGYCSHFVKP